MSQAEDKAAVEPAAADVAERRACGSMVNGVPTPPACYFTPAAGTKVRARSRPQASPGGCPHLAVGEQPEGESSPTAGDASSGSSPNNASSNGAAGRTLHVDPHLGAEGVVSGSPVKGQQDSSGPCKAVFPPAAKPPGRSASKRPLTALTTHVSATMRGINRDFFLNMRVSLYKTKMAEKSAEKGAGEDKSGGKDKQPAAKDKEDGEHGVPDGAFCDSVGNFVPLVGEEIHDRFAVLEPLGSGSFGVVLRCFDQHRLELVAVKVLRADPRFTVQGRTEARILTDIAAAARPELFAAVGGSAGQQQGGTHLQEAASDAAKRISSAEGRVIGADHVLKLRKAFEWRGHVCIVTELLGKSLYDLLRISHYQGVSLRLAAKFGIQLGRALSLLASLKKPVVHVDVKPENILLVDDRRSAIKLVDFGSSCYEAMPMKAQYAQSRFCRAPEVMLRLPYNCAVDTWSAATVLFEMHVGTPIFDGKSEPMQLQLFQRVLGPIPPRLLFASRKVRLFRMLPQDQATVATELDPAVVEALPDSEKVPSDPKSEVFFELLTYDEAAKMPGGVAEPDDSKVAQWDSAKPISILEAAMRIKTQVLKKRQANVARAELRRRGEAPSKNTPPSELPRHIDLFCLMLARMLRFDPEERSTVVSWSQDAALGLATEPAPATS